MFKVAIDGPGGAGKSTISMAAAKQKGLVYIDTGAMYRAAALFCGRADFAALCLRGTACVRRCPMLKICAAPDARRLGDLHIAVCRCRVCAKTAAPKAAADRLSGRLFQSRFQTCRQLCRTAPENGGRVQGAG